jgi:hypothetical protein
MSGLIWAGIGKGIADAGQTFGAYMAKDIEANRQDEREALREERLLARQEALEQLKADRARTTEEELQQRIIKESADIRTKASEIGTAREGRAFDRLAESSAMAGEQGDVALSKEQLQKLVKDNPELGEQYKKLGLIESSMPLTANQRRMQRAEDEEQAARDIGAHSSVQKSLVEKRKSVLEEIRLENTEKKNDQQFTATMAAITQRRDASDARVPILQQTADARTTSAGAAVTNANRPRTSGGGSGGSASSAPKVRSTKVDDAGNMVAIMSDGTTKALGIKSSDFNNKVASLITQMSKNDYQFNKLTEEEKRERAIQRLTGGAAAPKTSDNRTSTSGTAKKDYSTYWK